MRIDLGAPVRTKDGHGAGHVKKAIWDPKSNQIIGYVVATGGLLGHEAVVSPESIEAAKREGDDVILNLTKKELDETRRDLTDVAGGLDKNTDSYESENGSPNGANPPASYDHTPGEALAN